MKIPNQHPSAHHVLRQITIMRPNQKPVPLKSPPSPPFKYAGGKFFERKKIVKKMPPHKIYVEPFAGAANVLLAKPPSQKEVLSDANPTIMKVHKSIKARPTEWNMTKSRRKWEQFHAVSPSQRSAYQYAYVLRNSYGGKGDNFNQDSNWHTGTKDMTKQHEREKNVVMKTGDFAQVMRAHDSKQTLHYLDPPYSEKTATAQYGKYQLRPERVATISRSMKGKVMISMDNHANVRRLFNGGRFRIHTISTRTGIAGEGEKKRTDLLITNFNPSKERQDAPPYIEHPKVEVAE